MTSIRTALLGLALALGLAAQASAAEEADGPVLVMATGDVTGSYFPAGVALCRVANEGRRGHGLRCSAVPSAGSLANLAALRDGAADLAIAQADAAATARAGTGDFAAAGPFPGLRSVAALYPEPLTLVARPDAGVAELADLAGKRVGVGPQGSGQRALIDALTAALGWRAGAFDARELGPAAAAAALCEGAIDAFFFAVGHPALAIREAVEGCGATIVPLEGPAVDAIVAGDPTLFATTIPAGAYRGVESDVPTFGVGAVLLAREDTPAGQIEAVAGAILDNLAALAGFEPTLAALDPAEMPRRGLPAPLHPGAEAAFRARGLLD